MFPPIDRHNLHATTTDQFVNLREGRLAGSEIRERIPQGTLKAQSYNTRPLCRPENLDPEGGNETR